MTFHNRIRQKPFPKGIRLANWHPQSTSGVLKFWLSEHSRKNFWMTVLSSKYDWHFSILDFWLSKYDAMIRSLFWKIFVTLLWSTCNLSRDSMASRTLSLASFNRSHHSSSSGLSRSFASKTFFSITNCCYSHKFEVWPKSCKKSL